MHSRLEQYVEQVETRLVELPPAQRESETEEMRQHIAAMVEARMTLGLCEDKAITETLEQFGQAQTVSRELAQAHDRNHKFLPDNLLTATVCAILCTYGGVIPLCLILVFLDHQGHNLFDPKGGFYAARIALMICVVLLSCLGVGRLTGVLFPRRAISGIGCTFLLYCAMGISQISGYHLITPLEFLQVCGFWAVLAVFTMAGAKMGARWRKRRYYRRKLAA